MNNFTLNIRHIRAFCETAKFRSISKAASRIHLSQPAITQAIHKLELSLGLQLFVRSNVGMHINEPGKLFFERSIRLLSLISLGAEKAVAESQRVESQKAESQKTTLVNKHGFAHFLTMNQLNALCAIEEGGSFSHGAKLLGISQPSMHRIARELERLADISFFNVIGKRVELTNSAKSFVAYVHLALAEFDQAITELNEYQGIKNNKIVVGTLPLARTYILPKTINQFAVQYPQSTISVVDGPYEELITALRKGQVDFILGALRDEVPFDDIVQTSLFEDRLGIYGHPNHPLLRHENISKNDLKKYPWIVPRKGAPTRDYFDAFFIKQAPERIIESSSLILLRGLMDESDRLTMISAHQIIEEVRLGHVARLPVSLNDAPRPIGLSKRKGWRPTKTQDAFLKTLLLTTNNL